MHSIDGRTLVIMACICLHSMACSTPGPGLFARRSPHEQYGQRLADAGLHRSALGRLWFQAAGQSLTAPLTVSLPYREIGYFAAERPSAAGLRFAAKRGEKLSVALEKKPPDGFAVFCDVWTAASVSSKPALLAAGDTTGSPVVLDIKEEGDYIVRIQPELLKSGEYTLTITTGPSLAFPVHASARPRIGSFWGAGRDNGVRKHEGIDIFAPRRSPALACADGVVTSVSENNLGGKVVFMRPDNRNYALYYAHLDTQLVYTGQRVHTGDTLGLTGNTGNARFTPSHLHFGVYAAGGAIDPLPFVNPVVKEPAKPGASLVNLGKYVRSGTRGRLYGEPDSHTVQTALPDNTLLYVDAASAGWYKVVLPDGLKGFVSSSDIHALSTPLKRLAVRAPLPLFDEPDTLAAKKTILAAGRQLDVLASYKDFYFVGGKDSLTGWIAKQLL